MKCISIIFCEDQCLTFFNVQSSDISYFISIFHDFANSFNSLNMKLALRNDLSYEQRFYSDSIVTRNSKYMNIVQFNISMQIIRSIFLRTEVLIISLKFYWYIHSFIRDEFLYFDVYNGYKLSSIFLCMGLRGYSKREIRMKNKSKVSCYIRYHLD